MFSYGRFLWVAGFTRSQDAWRVAVTLSHEYSWFSIWMVLSEGFAFLCREHPTDEHIPSDANQRSTHPGDISLGSLVERQVM